MNTSNSAEQLDPFAPDEELGDSKDAQETEKKRKGRMQGYFRISLILGIILWLVDFLILFLDWHSFAALSFFCVIYTVVMVWGYVNSRAMYLKEMSNYTEEFHNFEDLLLQELDMPYAMLDEGGHILWMNPAFEEAISRDRNYKRPISTVIPALTRDVFPTDDKTVKVPVELVGNSYSAQMRRVKSEYLAGSQVM